MTRTGLAFKFVVPVRHFIDFAGVGWDGCYNICCRDEAAANMIEKHFLEIGVLNRLWKDKSWPAKSTT
jgi:hypothetical protein